MGIVTILTFLIISCLGFIVTCTYSRESIEDKIVGIWKHHKDEVFLTFRKDKKMSLRIPFFPKSHEFKGRYEIIDENILKIEFNDQFYLTNGEIITSNQVMKIIIEKNRVLLYGITMDELEGEVFTKVF